MNEQELIKMIDDEFDSYYVIKSLWEKVRATDEAQMWLQDMKLDLSELIEEDTDYEI